MQNFQELLAMTFFMAEPNFPSFVSANHSIMDYLCTNIHALLKEKVLFNEMISSNTSSPSTVPNMDVFKSAVSSLGTDCLSVKSKINVKLQTVMKGNYHFLNVAVNIVLSYLAFIYVQLYCK